MERLWGYLAQYLQDRDLQLPAAVLGWQLGKNWAAEPWSEEEVQQEWEDLKNQLMKIEMLFGNIDWWKKDTLYEGEYETAESDAKQLENFISIIGSFPLIGNAAAIYYTNRELNNPRRQIPNSANEKLARDLYVLRLADRKDDQLVHLRTEAEKIDDEQQRQKYVLMIMRLSCQVLLGISKLPKEEKFTWTAHIKSALADLDLIDLAMKYDTLIVEGYNIMKKEAERRSKKSM